IVFQNKILCTYVYDNLSLSRKKDYKSIKLNYKKYRHLEKSEKKIKAFLDLNRYAEILANKLLNQNKNVVWLKSQIDFNNLSTKQKTLLFLPNFALIILYKIQPFLIKLGLRKTIYK